MEKDFDRWNKKKKRLDQGERRPDFHEREIWWCSIGVNVGSEQHSQTNDFSRPVVIIRRFTRDLFLGVPLTTKTKDAVAFRFRFVVGDIENDALVLQMRAYDNRRLIRKIGTVPEDVFAGFVAAIHDAIVKTEPRTGRGSSEAEANV